MEWFLWLISLAIAITIAVVCYRIAEGKGRSGVLWGVIGFIFPIIGLIVILVLSDKSRSV
jgi:predicted cobalt transporter CbtA